MKKRPWGVTVSGWLFIVWNTWGFLVAVGVYVLHVLSNKPFPPFSMWGLLLPNVAGLLLSVAGLLCGYGLLNLKHWAYWLTLALAGWHLVYFLLYPGNIYAWFLLLILVGVIWYFLRPSVRAQLQKR